MRRLGVLALVVFMFTSVARLSLAEKVDLSNEQLFETATHVIDGHVLAIYSYQEESGDWQITRYVAEIAVERCTKGDIEPEAAPVYVRYWTRKWIGEGTVPPSTNGHRGLPSVGDHVHVYLAKNAYDGFTNDNKDGGFNVIGANGFDLLRDRAAPETKPLKE
jgi:hypothetical protein